MLNLVVGLTNVLSLVSIKKQELVDMFTNLFLFVVLCASLVLFPFLFSVTFFD